MSKGINVLDDTVLANFLGVDGIEELRSKLIDMIVEEVHEQLHQSSNYIISPDDIATEIFNRAVDDLYTEVSDEYKKRIIEAVDKRLIGLGV